MKARCLALIVSSLALGCAEAPVVEKVPVTTSSEEARRLYLEGRDLEDKVRNAEARERYQQAIALDPSFARAHLDLASVAANGKEFFENLATAVSLADIVSRGERQMIYAFHAGVNSKPMEQFEHLSKLVELYPDDERARTALGNWYFGTQEWRAAIDQYTRATELAPDFPGPYNQLGYAHRYLENWRAAESAFKTYIELLPNEPNPYDSYAEMLMKMGRFEDSIAAYRKALEADSSFVPSYRGIGNDYIFLGQPDRARETFARLASVARNEGQRRQALLWTAASYIHEGRTDEALTALKQRYEISEKQNDVTNMAGDVSLIGNVLLDAGRTDEALERFEESLAMSQRADVPETIKRSARRNHLFDIARVQLEEGNLEGARATLDEYRAQVVELGVPFEVRALHHLEALIAFADGASDVALAALEKANQQDPRVLLLRAKVLEQKGDAAAARKAYDAAANFNGLNFNYAFVRQPAHELMAKMLPN